MLRIDEQINIPAIDMESPEGTATQSWLDLMNRALRSDTRVRVQIHGAQAPAFVQGLRDLGIRGDRLEIGEPEPASGIRVVKL